MREGSSWSTLASSEGLCAAAMCTISEDASTKKQALIRKAPVGEFGAWIIAQASGCAFWLRVVNRNYPPPPVFRICGKQRSCRRAILDLRKAKDLQVRFSDLWQILGLAVSNQRRVRSSAVALDLVQTHGVPPTP